MRFITLHICLSEPTTKTRDVLREHRPPPNASIIELLNDFCRASVLCVLTAWQSSRIRIVIWNGLPDPDSRPNADHHQNVISWSLGHTPAFYKISSKSVGDFFDNPMNSDFGLRTPGSGSSPKLNSLVPGHALPLQEISSKSVHNCFSYPTDRQTDKQTEVNLNITSFFVGGNEDRLYYQGQKCSPNQRSQFLAI